MEKLALAGCVVIEQDAILLLHRIKSDWYELPGGKIEEMEGAEETAIREFSEELSCDVEIIAELAEKDFIDNNGYECSYTWFLAKIVEGRPKVGEPEKYDHFKFVPLKELSQQTLSPNMKNFSDEIQKGTISFLYSD